MRNCITAIIDGFKLCLFQANIRKLAIKPWLIGVVCYFLSLYVAYHTHGTVVSWLISDPSSWWTNILFYLVWFIAALILVIVSLIASVAIILVLSGFFQSSIALEVLKSYEIKIPEEDESIKGLAKEAGRSILLNQLSCSGLVQ